VPDEATRPGSLPGTTDVVVIGGGIAGTAAAYHLASAGLSVMLVERNRIGGGATGAAIGVLSPPLRQPFHETVHHMGADAATELWRFALQSVAGLAELLKQRDEVEVTELDLGGGYVLAEPHTEHDLARSFEALEQAGLPVEWLPAEVVRKVSGGRGFTGGMRIDGLGAFWPDAVARALARAAADAGALVVEDVSVERVESAGDGHDVTTSGGRVRTTHVVYASHVESGRFSSHVEQHVVPIRGQGFVTAPIPRRFDGAFSTHWKLNVWRQDSAGRLVVSGWRHDAWDRSYGEREARLDDRLQSDLHRWFEAAFPVLGPLKIERRWSGLFGWTADFLPLVGAIPGSVGELATTGFSGGGLPFAFGSGRVIADLVIGRDPLPGAALLEPARFATR